MSQRLSASDRAALRNEKPAQPKGLTRTPIPQEHLSDTQYDDGTFDAEFEPQSKGNQEIMDNKTPAQRAMQQAQEQFGQSSQSPSTDAFTRPSARKVGDFAHVDDIKSTVTSAADIEGEWVVLLTAPEYKDSYVNGQKVLNAWFDAYLQSSPDETIRLVVNGYMVINQLKTLEALGTWQSTMGYFIKNKSQKNRWEFRSE